MINAVGINRLFRSRNNFEILFVIPANLTCRIICYGAGPDTQDCALKLVEKVLPCMKIFPGSTYEGRGLGRQRGVMG